MPRRSLAISVTALVVALVAAFAFPRLAAMDAVEQDMAAPAAAGPAQEATLIAVASVNVNLRTGPSLMAARLRLVLVGATLTVLDQSEPGWLRVETAEGVEGWVMAQYVTLIDQASEPLVDAEQQDEAQPVAAPAPPAAADPPHIDSITGIGDSIMLSAAGYMRHEIGLMDINAVIGRQTGEAIEALRWQLSQGRLGDIVIVHIGTNGPISAYQFDQIMGLVGPRQVVFVNIRAPRVWEGSNNWLLANKVADYPNASLVDWHNVAVNRADFFMRDGVHLSVVGRQAYARMIAAHLSAR